MKGLRNKPQAWYIRNPALLGIVIGIVVVVIYNLLRSR